MAQKSKVDELHILWISEGMSCDGDSVAMTAATQPSIEDIVLGLIPGIPKVHVHNKVLDPATGDDLVAPFHAAARGELGPYVFVVEGSIPNEEVHEEGYFTSFGYDHETGQPITLSQWIDWLAPKALAVVAAGTCATYGGIHAMAGNPTGCMGLADYLGWDFRTPAGIPIVNVPGCPIQPDNFMETLLWLLYQAAGSAPMIPLDERAAAPVALRQDRARGLRPGRLLRAGRFRQGLQLAEVPGGNGLLGAGRQLQRAQARVDERDRRLPERRRDLHRLHHAGLPRQVHALHGRAAGRVAVLRWS